MSGQQVLPSGRRPVRTGAGERVSRCGFSAVELLVSIVVLGVLLAILVPAVQNARATSRRMQCLSNLHQLSVAVHNRLDAVGRFPGDQFQRELLPYIEQATLAKSTRHVYVEFASLATLQTHPLLRDGGISVYACPADPAQAIAGARAVNYVMNLGSLFGGETDGLRSHGKAIRPGDITDGLSNTAAFSERLLYRGNAEKLSAVPVPTRDEQRRRMASTNAFHSPALLDEFSAECRDHAAWTDQWGGSILTILGCACGTDGYNHILTPNQNSCYNGVTEDAEGIGWRTRSAARSSSSLHATGVNVMFADGSARLVSEQISVDVWRSIGTRNGGEPLDFDQL